MRYNGFSLQISTSPIRTHYVRATVRVYDHPDGTLAVFHGPRCLARHGADARPDRGNQTTGRMKPRPGPACGVVENAAALPTTPQAPRPQ